MFNMQMTEGCSKIALRFFFSHAQLHGCVRASAEYSITRNLVNRKDSGSGAKVFNFSKSSSPLLNLFSLPKISKKEKDIFLFCGIFPKLSTSFALNTNFFRSIIKEKLEDFL